MPINKETIKAIIDGNTVLLVDEAEKIGSDLARDRLTTSQIRNIYGAVKKFEGQKFSERTISELILLKPKLAYAAYRERAVKPLKDVLIDAIDEVRKNSIEERFKNFCKFFEAILAYHRAAGGK